MGKAGSNVWRNVEKAFIVNGHVEMSDANFVGGLTFDEIGKTNIFIGPYPQIEQVSLADIVLSGGETAALAILDACIRLLPGVMGAPDSGVEESYENGLIEYPQYTRPQEWEGRTIPEVLRSGDHAKIAAWRKQRSEDDTRLRRPDLWERHGGARVQSASGARREKKEPDQ